MEGEGEVKRRGGRGGDGREGGRCCELVKE